MLNTLYIHVRTYLAINLFQILIVIWNVWNRQSLEIWICLNEAGNQKLNSFQYSEA